VAYPIHGSLSEINIASVVVKRKDGVCGLNTRQAMADWQKFLLQRHVHRSDILNATSWEV